MGNKVQKLDPEIWLYKIQKTARNLHGGFLEVSSGFWDNP